MDKKPLIVVSLCAVVLLVLGSLSHVVGYQTQETGNQSSSRGTWLYVGGSGPGNYTAIQDAINTSSNGDTVFVYAGTYHENVIVNKTVILRGENKNTTILDGDGIGNVVLVCSNHVNISGFTIQGSGSSDLFDTGLSIQANYTNIFNNNITNNNNFGIVIGIEHLNLYHHNTVHNNLVSKNKDTNIWIEKSDNDSISNNVIFQDYSRDCICTRYSHYCTIENNLILDSPYGISLFEGSNTTVVHNMIKNCLINGISLSDQHHNIIGFNTIDNCTYLPWMGDGIRIEYQSSDNLIIGNSISNVTCTGIWLYSSSNNNIIQKNTIKNCQYYGIYFSGLCNNNKIFHNTYLLNSPENAYDICGNLWDDGYPCGGNYWDDYIGIDANGDGIGDTPYDIPGGTSQDLYPLIHPYEQYYILNISLDKREVVEGKTFNITVKSLGGTVVPNAEILFDNETTTTDNNGIVVLTAPSVTEGIVYPIIATKPGYTSDNDTILVKNAEPFKAIFIGLVSDLNNTGGEVIIFKAKFIFFLKLNPFLIGRVIPDEEIGVSRDYKGYLGSRFIFGIFNIISTEYP